MVSHGKRKTFINLMGRSQKIKAKNSKKEYFLEVNVEYRKKCLISLVIYHFYLKERKSESVTSLFVPYRIKKTMLFT